MADQNQQIIDLCFTVDTDTDHFFGNMHQYQNPTDKSIVGWRGFNEGKILLTEIADEVFDSFGNKLNITWFVRCDYQLRTVHGSYTYLLDQNEKWWTTRLAAGDDVQWHAHLYRHKEGEWYQTTNPTEIAEEIFSGKLSMEKFGIKPTVVRIGEAFHSNDIMEVVESVGIQADATAIPGRIRIDNEKTLDWENTPNHPYRPSRSDYRIPGKEIRKIWEIPMNTVKTQVSYDTSPLLRYVNPAFHPGVLDLGLKEFMEHHAVLTTICHPYEILPDFFSDSSLRNHPLLSFSPEAIHRNISVIFSAAESVGKKVRFVTMTQLMNRLNGDDV